ncbi:E3 ubiquitin-protein ligase PDZRN3-B-like [Nothobranchius furzeri]|uniref:E3 ubiquitin-protein ligase PDZRN3-B-like n=1 Tax=Nothobranchius furzeri TaxID=105023 RepID=UPI00240469B3|nr:E3 ubiquitin-protein ligase PDZRN3-B-like [Nothobranchius furzeri]
MKPHGDPNPVLSGDEVCGLQVSGEEHRCVEALRALTDALERRRATLEREARVARLRWNRRERTLLAQVTSLHKEALLAALKYQTRLHRYLLLISGVAEQIVGFNKRDFRVAAAVMQKSDEEEQQGHSEAPEV